MFVSRTEKQEHRDLIGVRGPESMTRRFSRMIFFLFEEHSIFHLFHVVSNEVASFLTPLLEFFDIGYVWTLLSSSGAAPNIKPSASSRNQFLSESTIFTTCAHVVQQKAMITKTRHELSGDVLVPLNQSVIQAIHWT